MKPQEEIDRINQEIRNLNSRISQLQEQIRNCKHYFDRAVYDPMEVMVPYGSRNVGQGSDPWFEPEGYTKKMEDRWSRTCTICGHKEYTEKKKSIVVGSEPDFGS